MFNKSARGDLWHFQYFRYRQDFAGRDAMLVEQRGPLPRGLRRQGRFYFSLQLKPAFLAVLAVDVTWVRNQIGPAQEVAKGLELFLLVGRNINEASAGLERARRTC